MLLLLHAAYAGDLALYRRALDLVERHYLRPEQIAAETMLAAAGERLETDIEWLLVDADGPTLRLHDGLGRWQAEVTMGPPGELPLALAAVEDAVRGSGLPLGEADPRVSLLRGAFSTLDRHSVVLHAEGLERFDERLNGTLSGIGATIGLRDRRLVVKALFEDGPADQGGLAVGDIVQKIGGVSTVGMDSSDATRLIRGEAGTSVTLTVDRHGELLDLTFVRRELTIPNVTVSVAPGDIGVLTIDHFSEQTHTYLQQGLDELADKGVLEGGLIIDLRGNSGGSLIESARAVDTFIDAGLIVTTAGRNGQPVSGLVPKIEARSGDYDMPLVVLMDHDTASGSEILAGALAELDRAVLVGQSSFGKGTVQKVYPVGPDIKVKLTVAEYFVAGEVKVADVGIAPDVAVSPVRFNQFGVWYPDPYRESLRFAKDTPHFTWSQEDEGWREEEPPPPRDVAMEVAAEILGGAQGGSRDEVLASASRQRARIQAAEDQRLVDAFAARDVDWRPAPTTTPAPPKLEIKLEPEDTPEAGEEVTLTARVVNKGEDQYRVAIRLSSDNQAWNDVVLPIGYLRAGETATSTAKVKLNLGAPSRTDEVALVLESANNAAITLDRRTITTVGHPVPPVAVTAALTPDHRVSLTVENKGDRTLTGLRARFGFPETAGVTLKEGSTEPVTVATRRTTTGSIGLELPAEGSAAGPPLGPTVALELFVEAEDMPRLARWDLELPRDGTAVRLEAPTVSVSSAATAPAGSTSLIVKVNDDAVVDHVVVYAGTETVDRSRYEPSVKYDADKVAWRPGDGRKLSFMVTVPVEVGTNRYVVVAEDNQGLRTSRDVYVLGTRGTEAVDAGG